MTSGYRFIIRCESWFNLVLREARLALFRKPCLAFGCTIIISLEHTPTPPN